MVIFLVSLFSVKFITVFTILICAYGTHVVSDQHDLPNFVLFLVDDVGYGDLSVYGHPTQEWNRVDKMATHGMRFTQWYSGDTICTPSRAALLTGRLAVRTGLIGQSRVLGPGHNVGLPKEEITIPKALHEAGYKSGIVGKWHLGINEFNTSDGNHLPYHHGFDWVGTILPWTLHATCGKLHVEEPVGGDCFLYFNDTLIQQPINLETMTLRMLDDAKRFIRTQVYDANPFFLYLPLNHGHIDLTVIPKFKRSSKRGIYGDNLQEMGWFVGEILDLLEELAIHENTLSLFVSDNGPTRDYCREGGTGGPLKGEKAITWEGGIRVPAIAYWPSKIPAGKVASTVVNSMDIFPTLLDMANVASPKGVHIDGKPITDVLFGKTEESPHNLTYYYCKNKLFAVRYKDYKIHFYTTPYTSDDDMLRDCPGGFRLNSKLIPCQYGFCDGDYVKKQDPPLIYDIAEDISEQWPLAADSLPSDDKNILDVVDKLIEEHRQTLVDAPVPLKMDWKDIWNRQYVPCHDPPKCKLNYP